MPEDASPFLTPNSTTARLWKNQGKYSGETIDIDSVLGTVQALAQEYGWQQDCFLRENSLCLTAYHLAPRVLERRKSVYISAGIHGDEPAGPLAVLDLVRRQPWPDSVEVWLCPCLNPSGFRLNSRENAAGLDLNRQYHKPEPQEIRAHTRWLDQLPPFDIAISLHEDWEAHGFYVYELNPDGRPTFADSIIRRVSQVCEIDRSPMIEGREAHGGIIRPTTDPTSRPQWPEAFYLITHKTRLSYTFEAPSDFALQVRVAALVAGVEAVLDQMLGEA